METLLITGASGLLGSKIVEVAREDYEVIPLHHTKPLHPNSVKLDITARKQVFNILTKLKPSIAIHTASETNVDRCETQNHNFLKATQHSELSNVHRSHLETSPAYQVSHDVSSKNPQLLQNQSQNVY